MFVRESSEVDAAPDGASEEATSPQQVLVAAIDDAARALASLRRHLLDTTVPEDGGKP